MDDLIASPYGSGFYDETAPWDDPYWVSCSDDGQYVVANDHHGHEVVVAAATGDGWSVEARLDAETATRACTADFMPHSHTFVYNDGEAVVEYDIDAGERTRLFEIGADRGPTYWPADRSKIQLGQAGGTRAEVRARDGSVHRRVDLATPQVAGTIVWNEFDDHVVATYNEGDAQGVARYTPDGEEQARIPAWDAPLHVYARGPYLTVGNEFGPALIMEGSGVMRTTYPERTNVVSIRDPPSTDGYEFVGTYVFSVWRVTESGLRDASLSQYRTSKGPMTVPDGEAASRTVVLRPDEQVEAWTTATVGEGVTHELRSPRPHRHVDAYPTAFGRLDDEGNVESVLLDSQTGETATWSVGGRTMVTFVVRNESGDSVDVEFAIDRGSR